MAKHAINAGQSSEIAPLAVTNFTATDVGTNRPYADTASTDQASAAGVGGAVQLNWTQDSGSQRIDFYTITTNPTTYTATINAPATSYIFEGLASNTSYTFSITPQEISTNDIPTIFVSSVTDTTFNVNWSQQYAALYNISIDNISDGTNFYASSGTATSYNASGAIGGTTYRVTVSGINNAGTSTDTYTFNTLASAPTVAFGATDSADIAVNITFVGNTSSVDLYYSSSGYSLDSFYGKVTSSGTYTLSGLNPSQEYWVSAIAYGSNGGQGYAGTATTYTAAPGFFAPPSFFAPPTFFAPPNFPPTFVPPTFAAGAFDPSGHLAPSFFSPPAFVNTSCWAFGTLITMADGTLKKIEDIRAGDLIMSADIPTYPNGEDPSFWYPSSVWSTNRVDNITLTQTNVVSVYPSRVPYYYVANDIYKLSWEHWMFIQREGIWQFMKMENLQVGDNLVDINNNIIPITKFERIEEDIYVVKLTAGPNDLFYGNEILTHNLKM
jgi:hypothetical protein